MAVEIIGFLIIVLVMMVVIVRREYIKSKLKTKDNLEIAANQLQLQIKEVADTVIDRMENRINHLEMLIDEADTKINQLDDKIQYTKEKTENKSVEVAADNEQSNMLENNKKIDISKDNISQQENVLEDEQKKESFVKEETDIKLSKTNKMVLDLFESGYTIDEVAKKTGIGKGAILLIKEMYK